MKKKIIINVAMLASVVGSLLLTSCGDTSTGKSIGILKFVEDTPLNLAEDGFIAGLKEKGFEDGKNITINEQNPNADSTKNTSMASSLVLGNDLVFGIATPSAVALKSAVDKNGLEIPTLFTAVTNPVGAGLVSDMTTHSENVCGMSDMTDVNLVVDALAEFGTVDQVGMLYNVSESNSQYQVDLFQKSAEAKGWTVKDMGVSDDNLITSTINSIPDGVDAIYIPTDNHIVDAISQVRQVAKAKGVITICADASVCEDGVMVGIGVDYETLGKSVGYMAAKILNGEVKDASEIACEFQDTPIRYINLDIAKEAGITVPQTLIDEADKVYGSN
ncbi:MAG: ABC transporter substrate-binding protein [Bacilli bacterium]